MEREMKSLVECKFDNRTGYRPAVNIKKPLWAGEFSSEMLAEVAQDQGYDAQGFIDWWRETDDDMDIIIDDAAEIVSRDGFEDAQDLAEYIWEGYPVNVYQEGRSGGWMVVEGLADVQEWDDSDLRKWEAFRSAVRKMVDDFPFNVASFILINHYDWHLAQVEAEREWNESGRWAAKFAGSNLTGMEKVGG